MTSCPPSYLHGPTKGEYSANAAAPNRYQMQVTEGEGIHMNACVPGVYILDYDELTHKFEYVTPFVYGFTHKICVERMAALLRGKKLFIRRLRKGRIMRALFGPYQYTKIQ